MYRFEIGDEVVVNGFGDRSMKGVVKAREISHWGGPNTYGVLIDDYSSLFWYGEDFLVLVEKAPVSNCECGLKFSRDGGRHSDWCRAYRPETK